MAQSIPNPYIKRYLMTAGPTPLPPRVVEAMAQPVVYHRSPAFLEIYERVLKRLKTVFQTEREVLVFTSSGSGAMESAVSNLVSRGEPALVASCGKFGERWKELCDAHGAETLHLKFEWGSRVEPRELEKALAASDGRIKAVFTTQSETSTGVVNDIKALTQVCHDHGSIICVDAVSGLGAVDLPSDEWQVDVVVSGSQKALMTPPGLGFVVANEKAIELAQSSTAGRYYFDWQKTLKAQAKNPPGTTFTPAVTLMAGLDCALALIEEETLPAIFARHALLGRAAREAAKALGLDLLGPEDENANAVTAVKVPEGIDGKQVVKMAREAYGVTLNGGQAELTGKIVRIAHCGYYGAFDILTSIAALELALADAGAEVEIGAGVACAQRVFSEAGIKVSA